MLRCNHVTILLESSAHAPSERRLVVVRSKGALGLEKDGNENDERLDGRTEECSCRSLGGEYLWLE